MKWLIGSISIVAAIIVVLIFGPRKEHVLAPPRIVNMQTISVTSSAFEHNGRMPERYTCDSPAEVSPPLTISGVPAGTKTLALIMHDPDAPHAGGWTHWVRFNIPLRGNVEQVESPKVASFKLGEGEEPAGMAGKGMGGESTYQGPCPPSGTHRYFFSVYALDTELSLNAGASKSGLEKAMEEHILGKGELVGLYTRPR